jgi:hypothetical protein
MKTERWFILCIVTFFIYPAFADPRYHLSLGLMALNSETVQGGTGPSGSTVLTQFDLVKRYKKLGYGIVFNYDKHGESETDSSYGLKFDLILDKFYFELAYLIKATRAYTDRAIAEETGDGLMYGIGARFPIGRGGKDSGPYFHVSYKVKTQNLKKQDGVDLSEPIKQVDGYPLFGFGYSF